MNNSECADFLTERQLCAGQINPVHDSCQVNKLSLYFFFFKKHLHFQQDYLKGDSGGPFVMKNGDHYYLTGVVRY